MKEYRIKYHTATSDGEATVTARDEKDARQTFKAAEPKAFITEIEIVRENVCATKQQEREALEKIKSIVAQLGPQSYLATAFEGCFQDAEDNIEDDAAYSMKSRYETAQNKLKLEIAEKQATKEALERTRLALKDAKDDLQAARGLLFDPDDLAGLSQLLADKVLDLGKEVSNAAARIVEIADAPESAAFRNAVKDHRAAQADLQHYNGLLVRVNNVKRGAQQDAPEQ